MLTILCLFYSLIVSAETTHSNINLDIFSVEDRDRLRFQFEQYVANHTGQDFSNCTLVKKNRVSGNYQDFEGRADLQINLSKQSIFFANLKESGQRDLTAIRQRYTSMSKLYLSRKAWYDIAMTFKINAIQERKTAAWIIIWDRGSNYIVSPEEEKTEFLRLFPELEADAIAIVNVAEPHKNIQQISELLMKTLHIDEIDAKTNAESIKTNFYSDETSSSQTTDVINYYADSSDTNPIHSKYSYDVYGLVCDQNGEKHVMELKNYKPESKELKKPRPDIHISFSLLPKKLNHKPPRKLECFKF